MKYGKARAIVESAIEAISERLVDDPIEPGQQKAPKPRTPRKPTAPTAPKPHPPGHPLYDPTQYYPTNDPRNPAFDGYGRPPNFTKDRM